MLVSLQDIAALLIEDREYYIRLKFVVDKLYRSRRLDDFMPIVYKCIIPDDSTACACHGYSLNTTRQ